MLNRNIINALASVAKEHCEDRDANAFVEEAKGIEGIHVSNFIAGDNSRYEIVDERNGDLIMTILNDEDWWKNCTSSIAYLQAKGA